MRTLLLSMTFFLCAAPALAQTREPVRTPAPRTRTELVRQVLDQNPTLEARRQAVIVARSGAPQADAWPDPVLSYSFAPLSIFSNDVDYGQTIQLSQRIPWPGKRGGRAEAARERGQAAQAELQVTELDLSLMASELYDDYYWSGRALVINHSHQQLLSDLTKSAKAAYAAGRAVLQDPLAAEVELAGLEQDAVGYERLQRETRARLNALLHRPPDAPLPPPSEVEDRREDRGTEQGTKIAADRPEFEVLRAQARAANAEARAAERDYYPDVTVMAQYSSMWPMTEHQWMVGVAIPLPLDQASRKGRVDEARARARLANAELSRVKDEIARDIDVAQARVSEAERVLDIYRKRLVPLAKKQVQAARAGFEAGNTDFATVITAEKNLRSVELARETALVRLSRSRASLSRARGELPRNIRQRRQP